MKNPNERLAEIRKRADARIAAIKQRNRLIVGTCTTLALCLVIGLAVYRLSSVPKTPPLQAADPTTTVCVTTTEPTATQTQSTTHSTTAASADTTTVDDLVFSTEAANQSTSSVTTTTRTTAVSTTASTSRSTHTSSSVTTTASAHTTAVSCETVTHTTTTATSFEDNTDENSSTVTTHSATITTASTTTTRTPGIDWSPVTTYPATTTTSSPTVDREPMAPFDPSDPSEDTTTTTTVHREYVCFTMSAAYEVQAGDIITLDVSISDNHYLLYGKITFYYDTNKLELLKVNDDPNNPYTDYVNTDILPENSLWSFSTPYKGGLEFAFMSTAFCGPSQGGTLFRLTFRVLEGFDGLTHINLNVPYAVAAADCNPDGSSNEYIPPKLTGSGYISANKKPSSPYW